MVGPNGTTLPLKAASWRAGGVQTAAQAGLSESMIMFLGRWTSCAWRHYLIHTPVDIQSAAQLMWASREQGPAQAGAENGTPEGAIASLAYLDTQCTQAIRAQVLEHINPESVARALKLSRSFLKRKRVAPRA